MKQKPKKSILKISSKGFSMKSQFLKTLTPKKKHAQDQDAGRDVKKTAIGICLGASTYTRVVVESNGDAGRPKIVMARALPHHGNPCGNFHSAISSLDQNRKHHIGITGRKFRKFINLPTLTEPEAVEYAMSYYGEKYSGIDAVVSAGGETFMVYILGRDGKISNVTTGNKCASGTGEFFLQQIRRMGLDVEEAVRESESSTAPHKIAGRCSVFCKSDCTHALNKGESKADITAGLGRMMAQKILELLVRIPKKKIMVIGGVTQNTMVMRELAAEINELIIPENAASFEALGAALWAFENAPAQLPLESELIKPESTSFDSLPSLKEHLHNVTFKEASQSKAVAGDRCIIGLDVGSTTTKAALVRTDDDSVLASIYLRTNGAPVAASRQCYQALKEQVGVELDIVGLAVTGSGRQIAGLHGLTDNVINEIIAHATAAVYYDPEVDTIFEIGGQDAKYTYIINGVPSDYAMNEACSAGTGSFLEESAKECLGVDVTEIAELALEGDNPPNFNDQCAAFISSDIKTSSQEGIDRENIVAGLVYSICMNYTNRVKGSRPVGRKVFMQGGVCYNKAVPVAMSALTGKEIVVPPDPGMMGAFGVALELKKRLELGLAEEQKIDLKELADRKVEYKKSFICAGGREKCDRKCSVALISIEGKNYPFGGACNKYYGMHREEKFDVGSLDLAAFRHDRLFQHDHSEEKPAATKSVGINRSLMIHSLYPLFRTFFDRLGLDVVLPDEMEREGVDRKGAAFCYPVDVAHGYFSNLLKKKPDFIFSPLLLELDVPNHGAYSKTCVFVQGEPFYLQSAFRDELEDVTLLQPKLNFSGGYEKELPKFIKVGKQLGCSAKQAREAYIEACKQQRGFSQHLKEEGRRVLDELKDNPDEFAIVLFGRPYNAFAPEINMGIPHKIASRGFRIIPFDFLPYEDEPCDPDMYWGNGQMVLKAAALVEKHPQLYGAYISNFSCGPDSFIISYFRDIMGAKPSLTLELDEHTADAGLDTRIEAFIDIIKRYREIESNIPQASSDGYQPAKIVYGKKRITVVTSDGEKLDINHPRIHVLVPSMGRLGTQAIGAVLRKEGIRATALPPPDKEILKIGRGNTSCKECLPMQLTTGSLLRYIYNDIKKDEVVVYFLPKSSGPCRFGQYNVFIRNLINKNRIKDVALISLTDENSYAGLGDGIGVRGWRAMLISDAMQDIRNTILVLAVDKKSALALFDRCWEEILNVIETSDVNDLFACLEKCASELKSIELKTALSKAPVIALVGEIYVRCDQLSRQGLIERLAERGFVVKLAPIGEWIGYTGCVNTSNLAKRKRSLLERGKHQLEKRIRIREERRIKKIFSQSNLYEFEMMDVERTIDYGGRFIDKQLLGEAILTVGLSLREMIHGCCGVISIGPFGCMPSRVAEAILSREMNTDGIRKAALPGDEIAKFDRDMSMPFLPIETDGKPFPQVIEARLETFCLQARRMHQYLDDRSPGQKE
jgi:predicted CoA-substrate-specific enzyme activase